MAFVDAAGNTVVQYTYGAWGEKKGVTGPMATTLGKHNPFRYRGYVYDEETWMYYLRSRYYYPELQRFIGADVAIHSELLVFGYNAFCYGLNSPANAIDVDGELTWPGEIHRAVQLYIAAIEPHMKAEIMVIKTNGKTGRIDLFRETTGEVWEIKPYTSIEERALTQLESYIAASFVGEKYPDIMKKSGGYIAPGSFPYLSITGDAYSVVYSSEFTPSIIRYSFKKMSADEKRANAGKFFMVPSSKRVTLVSPSRTIVSSIPSTKSTKTSVAMGFGLVVGAAMAIAKFAAAVLTGNPGLVTP